MQQILRGTSLAALSIASLLSGCSAGSAPELVGTWDADVMALAHAPEIDANLRSAMERLAAELSLHLTFEENGAFSAAGNAGERSSERALTWSVAARDDIQIAVMLSPANGGPGRIAQVTLVTEQTMRLDDGTMSVTFQRRQ